MSDSEDENYAAFGSALEPLDEENLPRKKPVTIEDQYACDEQGRRRFHGAFTGGFSAGYFNSVGTRDGWRPQQFKSSRSSKGESKLQTPQDFMDDEDMGEFGIAPTAIRATGDYTSYDKKGTKRERARQNVDGPIPGTPVLRELLKPVKDTVGVKLLKKMGWKPGQGVGPRVTKSEKAKIREQNENIKIYGCSLPPGEERTIGSDEESDDEESSITFAPDDYEPFRCNPKDNYFGIGYSGLDKRPVLSTHTNLFDVPAFQLQDKNKKLSIRGQAFGVGAFEADDEDIYSREDMSQYDFALEPKSKTKSRWTQDKPSTSQHKCIEGFAPAKNNLENKRVFKPPELPRDFKPVHVVRKSRFHPTIEATSLETARRKGLARHDLSSQDRARIINDPRPIAVVLSNEDKTMFLGNSSAVDKNQSTSGQKCLFPCISDKNQGQITPNVVENQDDSSQNQVVSNQDLSKKPSVMSNIISKTLNLHGKEQTAWNQRQNEIQQNPMEKVKSSMTFVKEGDSVDIAKVGRTAYLQNSKTSWLEKLSSKSFVKGDTENSNQSLENRDSADPPIASECISNSQSLTLNERSLECADPQITSLDNEGSAFKPFISNLDKQKRYEQFLIFSKCGQKEKLAGIQPLSMTEWERDHERVEFEQAARLYKPLTGSMSDRFVSGSQQEDMDPLARVDKTRDEDAQLKEAAKMKMFGKLTRQIVEWQPASILCKRFNVPEPRSGCVKPETEKRGKFSVFDYLEASVHNTSTFQSATEIRCANLNRNIGQSSDQSFTMEFQESSRNSVGADKVSEKDRTFEEKYEEIFGKNVQHIQSSLGKTTDRSRNVLLGNETSSKQSSLPDIGQTSYLINQTDSGTTFAKSLSKSESGTFGTADQSEDKIDSRINVDAKKDLFKSIFLSSSDDSDSEREENLDEERFNSVLIGKTPSALNVQRNTSPPRGIFAKLDLDSLNDTSLRNKKINSGESKNKNDPDGSVKTLQTKTTENTAEGSEQQIMTEETIGTPENVLEKGNDSDIEMLPDMYGPVLPVKASPVENIVDLTQDTGTGSQNQKHVFKSVVVPILGGSSTFKGEWVEKTKDKKLRKEKKKHRHKEHKRHKHKKHKR